MNAFICILSIAINWSGAIVYETIDSPVGGAWTIDPGHGDANGVAANVAMNGTAWNRTLADHSNDTAVSGWRRGFADLLYGSDTTHAIVTAKPTEPSFDPGMDQGDLLKWLDNIAHTAPSVTVTIDPYTTKKRRKKKKKRKKRHRKGRNRGATRNHLRQGDPTLYPYQAMYGYEPYWANDRPTERGGGGGGGDSDYSSYSDSNEKSTVTTKEPECGDTLNCHRARANYGPVCGKNSVFMKKDFPDLCALEVENHCGAYQWIIAYRGVCRVGLWVQPTWMPHFKWHVIDVMKSLEPMLKEWTTIRNPPSPIYLLAMGRLGKTYRYDINFPP